MTRTQRIALAMAGYRWTRVTYVATVTADDLRIAARRVDMQRAADRAYMVAFAERVTRECFGEPQRWGGWPVELPAKYGRGAPCS